MSSLPAFSLKKAVSAFDRFSVDGTRTRIRLKVSDFKRKTKTKRISVERTFGKNDASEIAFLLKAIALHTSRLCRNNENTNTLSKITIPFVLLLCVSFAQDDKCSLMFSNS